jgi:hypothetical protein
MAEMKLTSVKVIKDLYDVEFKIATIRDGLNFQKLVNRALHLYTNDSDFKKRLDSYMALQISGSQF